KRHEIIDGEHYVTPSPNTKHQAVSGNLSALLWAHLRQHPIGQVFAAPFDVVFSDLDVVEPDLLYSSRERGRIRTDEHVRGAPELVVEILWSYRARDCRSARPAPRAAWSCRLGRGPVTSWIRPGGCSSSRPTSQP
ncbi:MAG: Uma2 family endonuclease, partial [Acidobacteria bacterium]|nr:Uma2 family endonuclease [Acidobacteriota bacterium]